MQMERKGLSGGPWNHQTRALSDLPGHGPTDERGLRGCLSSPVEASRGRGKADGREQGTLLEE